jgi:hypothetical protein
MPIFQLLADSYLALVPVHILPGQSQNLALTHPGGERQLIQRGQAILSNCTHKRANFLQGKRGALFVGHAWLAFDQLGDILGS